MHTKTKHRTQKRYSLFLSYFFTFNHQFSASCIIDCINFLTWVNIYTYLEATFIRMKSNWTGIKETSTWCCNCNHFKTTVKWTQTNILKRTIEHVKHSHLWEIKKLFLNGVKNNSFRNIATVENFAVEKFLMQ